MNKKINRREMLKLMGLTGLAVALFRCTSILPSQTFAFVHTNVIPMDKERVLSDQTVIVQNGRISEIGDAMGIIIPTGAIRIDAAGQYLIPTLADMHIHLEGQAWNIIFPPDDQFSDADLDFNKILFPYIANGIITAQVMSALPDHISLRDRINQGEILGPRLVLSRMIDGSQRAWAMPRVCLETVFAPYRNA